MSEDLAQRPLSVLERASSGRLGRLAPWWEAITAADGPTLTVAGLLLATFVAELFTGGAQAWGLSGAALAEGRWATLALHMLAHAGPSHLWMNLAALLTLGSYVSLGLGVQPAGWLRFMALFFGAGLVGALTYLAINPFDSVPMVGASGAVCGLWGAATRLDPAGGIAPLRSRRIWDQVRRFTIINLILFSLLLLLARLSGADGGLAWESHLGGFLFGLLLMPRLVRDQRASQPPSTVSTAPWT